MSPLAHSVLATLAVSAIALIGIVVLVRPQRSKHGELLLLSFAAGVLLATSFLELMPEAVALNEGDGGIFVASLLAMIGFFLLERLLHGFHSHDDEPHRHVRIASHLVLVGDGLHNFIDGVVIAASFAANPQLGVATTIAVAVHEIPQEIADFGVLISGGFSRQRALLLNFTSGLTAVLGALVFFAAAPLVDGRLPVFMAATAGMFIYIAASDLIPQLHHHRGEARWTQLPFFVGVLLIAGMRLASS